MMLEIHQFSKNNEKFEIICSFVDVKNSTKARSGRSGTNIVINGESVAESSKTSIRHRAQELKAKHVMH